jgi:hypothetical protein
MLALAGLGLPALSGFLNWKVLAALGAVILIVLGVWRWDVHIRDEAVAQQQAAILAANQKVLVLEQNLAQQAQQLADARNKTAQIESAKINSIATEASNAGSSDDGALAPVMSRTLSALRSLQQPAPAH